MKNIPLQQTFQSKSFLQYRNTPLTETDKIFLLDKVQKEGIWGIRSYLGVVEALPMDLLKPILEVAVEKMTDVSSPKFWMPDVMRIFEAENVQKVILEILQDGNTKTKCKAASMLYWIAFSIVYRLEENELIEVAGRELFWNGEKYAERNSKIPLEVFKKRTTQLRHKRYKVLLEEFEKSDNLVAQYSFSP